jgi:16S rRNA (guanine527-N7)-methyltransferase
VSRKEKQGPQSSSGSTNDHPKSTNDHSRSEDYQEELQRLGIELSEFSLQLTDSRRENLLRYANLVARRAREFNLVSKTDLPHLVDKHIAASLGALLLLKPMSGEVWIDIGTGAGFPGMVLKIWEPEQPVVLVESSAKRCLFLEEAAKLLRLDVTPLQVRGEELNLEDTGRPPSESGGIASGACQRVFMTRAVDPLPRALTWLPLQLRPGDRWLYYSGPGWEDVLRKARVSLEEARLSFMNCLEIPFAPGRIMSFKREA